MNAANAANVTLASRRIRGGTKPAPIPPTEPSNTSPQEPYTATTPAAPTQDSHTAADKAPALTARSDTAAPPDQDSPASPPPLHE
eukprot:CAMPEP_0171639190 /NCGR_PEP_ID=MMETSP0990-20121206/29537_1 /TAXON_ID=483369 /ORGANISM="non described non described, Strain CCMP2098" /LENGTH=84 /DNA_ID=CAMNT_0012212823 /DNA_START=465 /DNA_END=719 /DNA_ORIENTATION=-